MIYNDRHLSDDSPAYELVTAYSPRVEAFQLEAARLVGDSGTYVDHTVVWLDKAAAAELRDELIDFLGGEDGR